MDDELFMSCPEEAQPKDNSEKKSLIDMIMHMKPDDLFTEHFKEILT
jgi:hypothetical protein